MSNESQDAVTGKNSKKVYASSLRSSQLGSRKQKKITYSPFTILLQHILSDYNHVVIML